MVATAQAIPGTFVIDWEQLLRDTLIDEVAGKQYIVDRDAYIERLHGVSDTQVDHMPFRAVRIEDIFLRHCMSGGSCSAIKPLQDGAASLPSSGEEWAKLKRFIDSQIDSCKKTCG